MVGKAGERVYRSELAIARGVDERWSNAMIFEEFQ